MRHRDLLVIGFIRRYSPLLGMVAGIVASVIGMFVAVAMSLEWLLAFLVVTFLVTTIGFAFLMHADKMRAEEQCVRAIRDAEAERKKREDAEDRLNQGTSVIVARIEEALGATSMRQYLWTLRRMADYVARMAALSEKTGEALEVRQVERQGELLYVIAKADDGVAKLLRQGDRFILTKTSGAKVRHAVAVLEVHQVGGSLRKCVAFVVREALDSEIHDGLAALARTTDVKGLDGLAVVPNVSLQLFEGVDMQVACDAFGRLESLVVPPRELDDGD